MKIDPLLLVVCVGGLCAVGGLILVVFNALGGVVQIIGGLAGLFLDVLGSGPVGWCGCFAVLGLGCGLVWLTGYVLSVVQTCGTAQAINLCRLLGY